MNLLHQEAATEDKHHRFILSTVNITRTNEKWRRKGANSIKPWSLRGL